MPQKKFDLVLTEHQDGDNMAVSRFIRNRFERDYSARLTHLMPRLLSLTIPSSQAGAGEMVAAFGLREAARERLFMECYLDEPVEQRIGRLAGYPVERDGIIEVGNLAARPGGARAMIAQLTAHLYESGFEWVTFTGVALLRSAFRRLGLHPLELARATPERLTEVERLSWGRYFDSRPVVMAGHVASGYHALCRAKVPRPRLPAREAEPAAAP